MRAKNDIKEKVKYFMSLPYSIVIIPEEKGYFAKIPELPGCMTEGDSYEDVINAIREAQELWIETALEMGRKIPLPYEMEEYSGKFLVRIPKYIHRKLVQRAKREGISLNQLVVALLSEALKEREMVDNLKKEIVNELKKELKDIFHHTLEEFEWRMIEERPLKIEYTDKWEEGAA